MARIDRRTLEIVADFAGTLGHRPEDTDEELLAAADFKRTFMTLVIREDVRRTARFHPEIDPRLERLGVSLEEVLACGLRERRIRFFGAVEAIVAERCFQAARGRPEGSGPSDELLAIRDDVYEDYVDLFDDADLAQTRLEYDGLSRKARRLASFLGGLLGIGGARREEADEEDGDAEDEERET